MQIFVLIKLFELYLRTVRHIEHLPKHFAILLPYADLRAFLFFFLYVAVNCIGVRAAPVIDTASHEFCGMLSVSDILDSLLHMYCTHQAEDPLLNLSNGLSEFTVKTWHDHNRRQLHHENRPVLAQFTYADADGSLLDAVTLMRDMRMLHLPILYRDKTLLHTLEHWRVLNFLHRHFSEATPVALDNTARTDPQQASRLFSLPLSQLRLGTYANLVTIPASTTLLVCLQTLQQQGLSAIPIVNDRNQLIEVYSRGDVAMLVNGRCDGNILQRSVGEVLSGIRGGVSFSGVTCIRTDVLGTVFERFERTGVQRIYIVGENGLEGVVSLSDMLRYFLHGF